MDDDVFSHPEALSIETDWSVVDEHHHTSLATALEGVASPEVVQFLRSAESNHTQPDASQTVQTGVSEREESNTDNDRAEQQFISNYEAGVSKRVRSGRLGDIVNPPLASRTTPSETTTATTRGTTRARGRPRGRPRGSRATGKTRSTVTTSNVTASSSTTATTRGTTRARGRPRGSRARGKATSTVTTSNETTSATRTTTRGAIRGRGRGRGRAITRESTTRTSNKRSRIEEDSDSELDSDEETHSLERDLDQFLTTNHSEDDSHPDEPNDVNRSVYCTARCSTGCKKCKCATAGYLCDETKCKCTNCNNLSKTDADPLSSWTTNDVPQQTAKFDASKSGPKNITDKHMKTVTDVVDLLWCNDIWNTMTRESNAYLSYCIEFKKEITFNRKERRRLAREAAKDNAPKKKKKKTAPLKFVATTKSSTGTQPPEAQQGTSTTSSATGADLGTASEGSTPNRSQQQTENDSESEDDHSDSDSESDEEDNTAPPQPTVSNNGTQTASGNGAQPTPSLQTIPSFPEWYKHNSTKDFSTVKDALTVDDLKKYFSCSVVMGLQRVSNYRQHWRSDTSDSSMYGNRIIKSLLSLARFKHIHRYIHYDPNWLEDKLNDNFKKYWNPKQNLAVDEAMIAWKGRVKFKQYQPAKPCKYGLKKFVLCDETGYVYSSWLYRGKESRRNSDAKSVVLDFAGELPDDDQQYVLYFDNYYASHDLSISLVEKEIYHVCTVRGNRPSWLFSRGMQNELQDTADSRQWTYRVHPDGKLVAYSYCDSKRCNFLSNYAGTGTHQGVNTAKPNVANVYNKYMGAVDKSDAMIHQCLPFPHRKNKWTRAFMFHSFKTALVNSWILYKHLRSELAADDKERHRRMSMTQNDFLERYVVSQNLWIDRVKYNTRHTHYPMECTKPELCEYCYTTTCKKKKSTCNFKCPACKVHLHSKCFLPFHLSKRIF